MTPFDLVITRRGARFMGRYFPCSLGRSGISAAKHEGDGATPLGNHRIVGCLYRPDRIVAPNNWAEPIYPRDLWSDDISDPNYNTVVKAPHPYSHEKLRRADPLYDLILLTDWNYPNAIPVMGSAIFLHRWRKPGHPTEGCVAFHPNHLNWIAGRIVPGIRMIVG